MRRITCSLAVIAAALPLTAATKWDKKVDKTAQAVRAASARAPGVALDTQIKAAELLRATHPQAAWQFATSGAEQLKTGNNSGPLTQRLTAVLMTINPTEGEKIARTFPEQSPVYNALISYWMKKEDPGRGAGVLREAWGKGIYLPSASSVLSALRAKRPEDAAALFREMLDGLQPEKATMEAVRPLIPAAHAIAAKDPAAAKAAFAKLLDVVSREKFNAAGSQEMIATYRLGGKDVETTGARDSFLLPIGIHLHSLDPDSYAKNERLFERWREAIAGVKPGEEAKAGTAVSYSYMTREALAARTNPRTPTLPARPAQPSKPLPFDVVWARTMSMPVASLGSLLRRGDLTEAQRLQAARELLRALPYLTGYARYQAADTAFQAVSERGLDSLLKPAAEALAAALADMEKCKEPACESMRKSGAAATSYDGLATAVRRSKLRIASPGIAARASLIDLRDVLEENYDFKLAGIHGGDYALKAQKGRVVMLNFWATW